MGEGTVRESGMDVDTRLCLTWRTSKDLLHSTRNSAQCHVAAGMGGEFTGEWMHECVWLSPFADHLKLSYFSPAVPHYKIKSYKGKTYGYERPSNIALNSISEHTYNTIKKCIIIIHDFALSVPKPYQVSPRGKASMKIDHNSTTPPADTTKPLHWGISNKVYKQGG